MVRASWFGLPPGKTRPGRTAKAFCRLGLLMAATNGDALAMFRLMLMNA
jgi:hypothetical protein